MMSVIALLEERCNKSDNMKKVVRHNLLLGCLQIC